MAGLLEHPGRRFSGCLTWPQVALNRHEAWTYERMLAADKETHKRGQGHLRVRGSVSLPMGRGLGPFRRAHA